MTDFALSWTMSRQRFVDEIKDLNAEQLNWKIHEGALSIGQMAMHLAGVEVSFISQLKGMELAGLEAKIKSAAADGIVNDHPCPFTDEEITPASVAEVLEIAKTLAGPLIIEPTEQELGGQVKSVLGPIIDGKGVLTRLGFHAAYHQGQAYTYKTSPNFPK